MTESSRTAGTSKAAGLAEPAGHETPEELDTRVAADDKTSWSRLGYELRQPTWDDSDLADIAGKTVVITGATNGLGRAAAQRLAELGARVVILARDEARGQAAIAEIAASTGNHNLALVLCDLASLDSVRAAADQVLATEARIDVLINNAGILIHEWQPSVDGHELVLATNLLGPYLLVRKLFGRLAASGTPEQPSRLIEVSSGGMYSQRIDVEDLQTQHREYEGRGVYSRTKRAQVIVTEMRAEKYGDSGVVFHSMHPGWAATPGVSTSIPDFEAMFRDILRTPAQGADTIVWLAAAREPSRSSGKFWQDRRVRETHRSDKTRETQAERDRLWDLLHELTD